MIELENEELMNVNGGAFGLGFYLGLGAFGIFVIGVIDGIMRPLKCR